MEFRLKRSIPMLSAAVLMTVALLGFSPAHAQQNPTGLVMDGTSVIKDKAVPLPPSQIHPSGLLGARYLLSEKNRLLKVDEEELLRGFRHRPGSHPWIGEHVGKWLHAAALTYACTGDPELRGKMDRVVAELLKTQEGDGYLGTYPAGHRFGPRDDDEWDVWVHKYDLIGLLTYYQYTGNKDALASCERIGDLLINTFGVGKKSLVASGTMVGMAATSVLEPMVLLYRATGEKRYLDFAKYIVSNWDDADGPHLLTALLKGEPVYKIANGKSYEMISDMVGLCELYRVTGEKKYLTAALNGWKDISANRLYLTGSGSSIELWRADYQLPNDSASSICETCVTVTWIQLNIELLRLLDEPRFAEELDKTLYNHLLAAQKPTGDDWCYYTPLEGTKHYDSKTMCCHSSGPRGIALTPTLLYTTTNDGVAVNVFSASDAELSLSGGSKVKLRQETEYPLDGLVNLVVTGMDAPKTFSIHLRVPAWTHGVRIAVNGKDFPVNTKKNGFATIRRRWKSGDTITYTIDMSPRIVLGDHGNAGSMAVMYGPLVLAADLSHNDGRTVTPAVDDPAPFKLVRSAQIDRNGVPLFETDGIIHPDNGGGSSHGKLLLVPYYAVGGDGSSFRVWMKRPGESNP